MKNNHTTTKPSLKDVKKTLNADQQLTTDLQCNLKGGCTNCEDNRRPPRADGSTSGGGGNWGGNWGGGW